MKAGTPVRCRVNSKETGWIASGPLQRPIPLKSKFRLFEPEIPRVLVAWDEPLGYMTESRVQDVILEPVHAWKAGTVSERADSRPFTIVSGPLELSNRRPQVLVLDDSAILFGGEVYAIPYSLTSLLEHYHESSRTPA